MTNRFSKWMAVVILALASACNAPVSQPDAPVKPPAPQKNAALDLPEKAEPEETGGSEDPEAEKQSVDHAEVHLATETTTQAARPSIHAGAVPMVSQPDGYSCGVACMESLYRAYDLEASDYLLRNRLKTDKPVLPKTDTRGGAAT